MTTLTVIANEIHEQAVADFKVSERFAYAFIMKVKRIRDERLYKELGFNTFDDYCDKSWNVVRRYMDQRIQIADAFGQMDFENTYSQIGHSKSLLLAQMEPEVRQQIEATVQVDETSVKRIKEIEKALQEAEREKENAKSSATHYEKLFNSIKNQPARVETKTVEVVPDHVQKKIEQLEFDNGNLRHGYKSTKEKLQQFEMKNTVEFNSEQAQKQREKLQHEADYNALELRVHITNFMEKAAITAYMKGALAAADPVTKKRLIESVGILEEFTNQIKAALNGRILGGIVNE